MSHTFAGRAASSSGGLLEKGRVDVTRVKRYWRGRAPEWVEEKKEVVESEQERKTVAPVIVSKTVDPRLERLSLSDTKRESVLPLHRRRAEIPETTEDVNDVLEEQIQPSASEHRAQLRLKLLETRNDEPALMSDIEEGETSSSGSETEGDASPVIDRQPMLKPVFVSAEERKTIQERQRLEEEEELEWEAQKQKMQQRIEDTREIVAQKIKEEEAALQPTEDGLNEAAEINTDDDEEDAEFESWKEREMHRIQRDKEELLTTEKYAIEREKLKNMTEEEREIYDKLNPKVDKTVVDDRQLCVRVQVSRTKIKKKWKFLQKYWHKGAYYQEDPDDIRGTAGTDVGIFHRDYSDPTGEDKMDKTMLPKVMQVKDFGRSGRTKWTHLVNEDTTDFNNPWTVNDSLRAKYNKRMAASEQEFQKPKRFRS